MKITTPLKCSLIALAGIVCLQLQAEPEVEPGDDWQIIEDLDTWMDDDRMSRLPDYFNEGGAPTDPGKNKETPKEPEQDSPSGGGDSGSGSGIPDNQHWWDRFFDYLFS